MLLWKHTKLGSIHVIQDCQQAEPRHDVPMQLPGDCLFHLFVILQGMFQLEALYRNDRCVSSDKEPSCISKDAAGETSSWKVAPGYLTHREDACWS